MPRRNPSKSTPAARGGYLSYPTDTPLGRFWHTVAVGSKDWFTWVNQATVFFYETSAGSFTARRETKQRGGVYWIGYKQHGKKLYKRYIGKPDRLTQGRLNVVLDELLHAADITSKSLAEQFPDDLAGAFAHCAALYAQRWSHDWKWAGQVVVQHGPVYFLRPGNDYLGSFQDALQAMTWYINTGRDNAAARRS